MTMIGVAGAGAFGTALAISLARAGRSVLLVARDADHAAEMAATRRNDRRLKGADFPQTITISADFGDLAQCNTVLLSVPMQSLAHFLADNVDALDGRNLVACCKGVSLETGEGPTDIIAHQCPRAVPAILTGPSFAADIAKGLPTALTLACADDNQSLTLQKTLSTPVLRLYRSADTTGAELGGALKNVVAIAAGIVMGAGLGDSARAALMTRGFAEMRRFAEHAGAQADTLAGLSGFGDMVLTCTSAQSRNFRLGLSLGQGQAFDQTITVEGAATSQAVAKIAKTRGIEMPITTMVAAVLDGKLGVKEATEALLSRPLKEE